MSAMNIDNYVVFKGIPLVMCQNNVMAYGDLSGTAFAEMVVLGGGEGTAYPGMMMVTIKSTSAGNEVLRQNEFKNGLWEALDYAYAQIERFNKKNS